MRGIDLFAGAGGFTTGAEMAGVILLMGNAVSPPVVEDLINAVRLAA